MIRTRDLQWDQPERGSVPVGWSFAPAAARMAPPVLNYYLRTATPNDLLVRGLGVGYTEPVMYLRAFFAYIIDILERFEIPYMVMGDFAAIFYGEPRLTLDVDIVVDMKPAHIRPLVAAFPIPDYSVSEEAIRDSLRRRFPFTVIQPFTRAKVDLVPLPRDMFNRWHLSAASGWSTTRKGTLRRSSAPKTSSWPSWSHSARPSQTSTCATRGILTTQWGQPDLAVIVFRLGAGQVKQLALVRALLCDRPKVEALQIEHSLPQLHIRPLDHRGALPRSGRKTRLLKRRYRLVFNLSF